MAFTIEPCPKCKQSLSLHHVDLKDLTYVCPPIQKSIVTTGINREVVAEFVTPVYPSHLTCPYCPAQALPTPLVDSVGECSRRVRLYQCPAKHKFYVHPEEIN